MLCRWCETSEVQVSAMSLVRDVRGTSQCHVVGTRGQRYKSVLYGWCERSEVQVSAMSLVRDVRGTSQC